MPPGVRPVSRASSDVDLLAACRDMPPRLSSRRSSATTARSTLLSSFTTAAAAAGTRSMPHRPGCRPRLGEQLLRAQARVARRPSGSW